MLSPSGFCEDMTSYAYLSDYRRNLSEAELHTSGWYNYFPADNSTYCEPTDAACELCDTLVNNGSYVYSMNWDAENASVEVYRQFCLGTDGCVCVMACESTDWEDNMMADCDDQGSYSADDSSSDASSYSTLLPLFFLLQLLLLGAFVYRRMLLARLMRSGPRPQPGGPYNNVNAISSPSNRLRLSGWRKMQTDLIERERKQGLFSLRSPRPDASTTAAVGGAAIDYEASASPVTTAPIGARASPVPEASSSTTPVVIDTTAVEDDRNSIAVLEERPGSSITSPSVQVPEVRREAGEQRVESR